MFIEYLRRNLNKSPWAAWLANDPGRAATETRNFIAKCFERLEQKTQSQILTRVQKADETDIDALIHELVAHELLFRMQLNPKYHPQVGGLTPDFKVSAGRTEFLLDVFLTYNPTRTIFCQTEYSLGTVDRGDRAKKIADRISEKSNKYKSTNMPLLLLVFLGDHTLKSSNIEQAAYGASLGDGNLNEDFPRKLSKLQPPGGVMLPDECASPQHPNLSAVVACDWFDTLNRQRPGKRSSLLDSASLASKSSFANWYVLSLSGSRVGTAKRSLLEMGVD